MSRRAIGAVLLLLLACGDEAGPGGGGGGISATIDGEDWESDEQLTPAVQYTSSGIYVLQGTRLEGSTGSTIVISLVNIPGPGTYPLGTGAGVFGGTAVYAEGSSNWSTPLSGAAGSITISTLTDTRIAGTFEFTGGGAPGNAAGTLEVTNGEFDLDVVTSGNVPDLPANVGSRISATFNGTAWNAATVALGGGNPWGFTASNTEYALGLVITNLTATGTYQVNATGTPQLVVAGVTPGDTEPNNCCWSNGFAGSTGSVTVQTLTATRSTGTFSFTLPAQPGTAAGGAMVVANGTFDIGRP